jgi:hypothetical protein
MQFRQENDSLVFLPQPQGGPRVSFKLVKSTADEKTFENLRHDFPQKNILRSHKDLARACSWQALKARKMATKFVKNSK